MTNAKSNSAQRVDVTGFLLLASLAAGAIASGAALIHWGYLQPWELLGLLGVGAVFVAGHQSGNRGPRQDLARSKWATRAEIEHAGICEQPGQSDEEGLYLGFFADAQGAATLRYKEGKHLLAFGPPGANKSAGLVVPNIAHLRRSMIVVDIKGELASITANKRAAMGRVIVLNPFGLLIDGMPHLRSAGWNPLMQLDPREHDFESDAHCIADALIDKSGGGNARFFESGGENLVAAFVMWERFTKGDKASLRNVRAELAGATLLNTLKEMANCDVFAIRNAGARLLTRLTATNSQSTSAQDVIDTVLANTRFLDDPRLGADMHKGGAIDFGALHHEITTIYLMLPAHELVTQAKWLRLFVNLALRQLYRNPPPSPAKLPPVLCLLDEFGNLGGLSEILNAMNVARGYRVQSWMFLQHLAQLKASYKDKWESFFSGAGAVLSFKTGDMETAEQLAKFYGNEERLIPTVNPNGITNTPHAVPLIRPEDICRLERGETISIIEPCTMPVKGRAPIYVKTRFTESLDPNPYFHG